MAAACAVPNLTLTESCNGSTNGNGNITFQKIRRIGFSAYILMCFLVVGFCMTMLALDTFIPNKNPDSSDNSTFYASTISFILGKFTILVMEKLVRTSTARAAKDVIHACSPRMPSSGFIHADS